MAGSGRSGNHVVLNVREIAKPGVSGGRRQLWRYNSFSVVLNSSFTLERLYGCSIEQGECDGTMIAIKDINSPVVESDTRLLSVLKSHAEGLLRRPPSMRSDLVQDVEGAVLDQLPSKPLTAAVIADKLGLSESGLRRRMAAQGVAFRDIVDRVRAGLASRYLADGQKVREVAYLCGFKSSSAFIAARQRWQTTKDHLPEGDD